MTRVHLYHFAGSFFFFSDFTAFRLREERAFAGSHIDLRGAGVARWVLQQLARGGANGEAWMLGWKEGVRDSTTPRRS